MVEVKLRVQPRPNKTRSYKHWLRNHGKIPAVIYGKDLPNKLVEVDVRNLESILRNGAGKNAIINLTVEEAKPHKLTVMIKDLQRDPVKGDLMHVDLQKISLSDKIHTTVPIHLTGEAEGVKKGGILQSGLRELEIECVPANIPDHISVDISGLDIGDSLTVADIAGQDGFAVKNDPATVIVSIVSPHWAEAIEDKAVEPAQTEPANGEAGNGDKKEE
ncbi:50S ribosomal protein L25/general stress protein Ctc [Thermincola ferriacetica]